MNDQEVINPINIDLSHPGLYSPIYRKIINCRSRYLLMYGGRDSAKSFSAQQHIIYLLLSEKYCKVVMLRKVYADIKDSQMDTLWQVIEMYGLESYFKYIKNPLEMTCLLNGNKVLCRGLDKPAKLKSISNPTIVHIEEADEIQYEDFLKTDTSIRGPKGSLLQLILTFNPESEEGWIPDEFFPPKGTYQKEDGSHEYIESTQDDTTILHTTYKHNNFCPKERGERYERLAEKIKNSNYYQVYCLGNWGNALEGLIFPAVKYADEFPAREDCKVYGFGLDFGFTNDPTALSRCALAHGELWFEELIYKTGLVNSGDHSICSELEKLGVKKGFDRIVADSAEPKSIAEINREGYLIYGVTKGKDSVEAGISLMKQYPINIVGASPNAKKEFRSYAYQKSKGGQNDYSNKPIDDWNHFCDSARYWCMSNLKKNDFFIM